MTTQLKSSLTSGVLKQLTSERLSDAECLLKGNRYDATVYLCGYVLETALKACVCKRLRVSSYPENDLSGKFKTHDFDDLLLLAGLRDEVSSNKHPKLKSWSTVASWGPEWRYRLHGSVQRQEAEDMIRVLKEEIIPWLKRRW